jgi:hypothetical protein
MSIGSLPCCPRAHFTGQKDKGCHQPRQQANGYELTAPALHSDLDGSWAQAEAGMMRPAEEVIHELRARLMRRTKYHIYYVYRPEQGEVWVLSVWRAMRGRGPELKSP